jgi:hypothetical protein
LSPSDTLYIVSKGLILQGSEKVVLDSSRVLHMPLDYEIHYFSGSISFSRQNISKMLRDSLRHSLVVSYRALPFIFQPEYTLHVMSMLRDSASPITHPAGSAISRFSADDIFGPGLQKSGSIFRGLTVGSNRDLSLNSGFRMQLAGKLTSDLDIVAALTDENVPIQPEGTTQTLQELDKVFIQLKSPHFGATLGDFVYETDEKDGGEFGRLSRKLQGATGTASLQDVLGHSSSTVLEITAATARGKYTTNELQGVEGNQGPYRLSGEDPSRRPIIIAGTERVYLNGQLLTRGETNDYTIDYSIGEVVFSARKLITNATRITVDFEYTDRQFTRNLVGATARVTALDDKLHLFTSITQEADDPDSPIDIALNDTLRRIIAASGVNRLQATVSGVVFVGRDSSTLAAKGQYILRDSLFTGAPKPILIYAPGDSRALYSVTFSIVDQMPNDSVGYNKLISGGYSVAGLGRGSYLPVQFLPIPELHRVVSGRASFAPASDITVSADYALSSFDRNRLSAIGDKDDQGGAYKIQAEYHPRDVSLAGLHLGELRFTLSDRFVDKRFSSLDRANEIEFNRNWNLSETSSADEEIREAVVKYQPSKSIQIGAEYGLLERTGVVRSSRTILNASSVDSSAPRVGLTSEIISSNDLLAGDNSLWVRQRGTLSYNVWKFEPGLRVETENRRENGSTSDSLFRNSFRYVEVAPSLSLLATDPVRASAEVQLRTEDSASAGTLARAFRSLTQLYDVQLREWNSFSSTVSLSIRRTDPSDQFAAAGVVGTNTTLVRSQMRYAPWRRALDIDALYEFAQERSATMRRVFLRVPKGTGNYIYKGDLNQNGLADDDEFEQTRFDGDYIVIYVPSDQLVPVVDLKTGFRIRLSLSKLIPRRENFVEKALAALSTETVARVEEKSKEPDAREIYFLHFSRFQNDSTTLSGSNLFTQDLYLFEADPTFSMRFRFNQRRGLLQLLSVSERSFVQERSIRVRSQLIKEIGNQTEFTNKLDQLFPSSESPRERDLLSNRLNTEFSYRPYSEWEVAFGTGVSRVTNRFGGANTIADLNDQSLRVTYAIPAIGQLRGEIQREEVTIANQSSKSPSEYPFELTNGEVVGKTMLWRLAFDYRISQYVQVSVNYDGRSEGGRAVVHNAKAEARAFF